MKMSNISGNGSNQSLKNISALFQGRLTGIYTSLDLEARSFEKCITIIEKINFPTYVSVS